MLYFITGYAPERFQHTAARRRLQRYGVMGRQRAQVSTHSRAEAAAQINPVHIARFLFQHTAARRRLHTDAENAYNFAEVSTHSRAEAAAIIMVTNIHL